MLVDGERVIYESAVISEYLEDAYPEVPLMPPDAYGRARVRLWTHFVATQLVPAQSKVRRSTDPEVVKAHWPVLHQHLGTIEQHLAAQQQQGGPWFFGTRLTLADTNAVPFIVRTTWIREADVLADYPAIRAWLEAFQARESYREVTRAV